MADVTTAKVPAPTASVNGSAPAPAPKREQKPREVPMIGVSASKEEYADIEAGLAKTLGGLNMKVGLGPFVLACALKQIRAEILKK